MRRLTLATFSFAVYGLFVVTFLYAIGFVGNFAVPKSIDSGAVGPVISSAMVDLALLGLFALQHSVMARPFFKAWWTQIVPAPVERSIYVLLATLILALLFWQWRAIPLSLWTIQNPIASSLIRSVFWAGWVMLLISTFLISHSELFGLRQTLFHVQGRALPAPQLKTPFF